MTKQRGFGVLWAATSLSNLADGLAFVAVPLIAASLTPDPRLVAGLSLTYAVVRLLFALPIGVWVDRLDRRNLFSVANILRGLALLALGISFNLSFPNILVLYLAMAVVAVFEGTADTAAVAILPRLVKTTNLDRANSKIAATQLVTDEIVGPPLGGFLFALAAVIPLYFMGALWAIAGLLALALPRTRVLSKDSGERTGVWAEAHQGISWLSKHRVVGTLALIGGLASFGYMLPFSILVLFAKEQLGLNSTGYGLLLAFSALGGLISSVIAPKLRVRCGYKKLIVLSLGLGSLSLAGLAFTTSAVLAGVLLALYVLHAVLWNICSTSLRQKLVPQALMGRVSSASKVLGLIGLAIGAAAGGALGTVTIALPFVVGAAVFLLCALLALTKMEHVPQ
ncbi:MFS transporter [Arthrobacter sp. S41]|uniref:MFS transporter n=1 Tax=Arthrobacter sp. S41 TaxID=2509721 RepID=UPI001036BDD9|nr:MFS transporter [Arthrobacter sp. S41]TAP26939.1 MFS transporter [Arthrobacter sp. S41]